MICPHCGFWNALKARKCHCCHSDFVRLKIDWIFTVDEVQKNQNPYPLEHITTKELMEDVRRRFYRTV